MEPHSWSHPYQRPPLTTPTDGAHTGSDSQSYALSLTVRPLGLRVFSGKIPPHRFTQVGGGPPLNLLLDVAVFEYQVTAL